MKFDGKSLNENIDGDLIYRALTRVHALLILQRMNAQDFVALHGESPEFTAIQTRAGEGIDELLKVVSAIFTFDDIDDETEDGD